jgi:two-component system, cell cycle sensor histidine kinase and response regulator CckA
VTYSTVDLFAQEAEIRQMRDELNQFAERAVRQRDALLALTAVQLSDHREFPAGLGSILEVSAATLRVSRASIWRCNADRTGIDCVDLFDAAAGNHSSGFSLNAAEFPAYFHAIMVEDLVAADEAAEDPRTREFRDSYLRPLDIKSMLDAPIHLGGAVIGVVCYEHCQAVRHWSADEKSFAVAVSNLVSLAYERFERQRAESALTLQSAALNAAAHAMVITDRSGTVAWVNPAFSRLTGYTFDEAIGHNPRELLRSGMQDDAFYREMWETLLDGRVWQGELLNRRKDGSTYLEEQTITPVTTGGTISHFVAIKRDLTDQRRLEGQFLQAQKMEVVGRLAGGIAHDFNNLLTVINGTAELALMDLSPTHPLREDFEHIQESGNRAASLTRQLLSFSRKQIATRTVLDVGAALTEFRNMLQRLIGEDIRLNVNATNGTGCVMADRSQFEQIILNLAVNARDAMPRGGVLNIGARTVDLDADFAATHQGVKPGPHVTITVSDNGTGIAPETIAKLFEPFFTTKEAGKGTGLGLATVYAIVEQSGGTIWVDSELGLGTTFTLYLPHVSCAPDTAARGPDPVVSGSGTLLVVEDDEAVRAVAVRILRSGGYRVLAAGDALAAMKALEDHGGVIDLIVTDVVLPGLGGRDLANQVEHLRPGVPVLFTSGYTDDTILAHGVRENTVHFIPKPYTVAALANKVREVLARRAT